MIIESRIDVRYPDADPMGIVHHAVYALWYEIGRMDMFAAIGFGYKDMHALGIDPPMVNLNMNYYAPVRYPDTVTVKTRIIDYAPKKIKFRYEAYIDGRQEPVADAESFHIWTGPNMKSLDISQALPEVYSNIIKACESK